MNEKRDQIARWLWDWKWNDVLPELVPWGEAHPIQQEGYREWADELIALVVQP